MIKSWRTAVPFVTKLWNYPLLIDSIRVTYSFPGPCLHAAECDMTRGRYPIIWELRIRIVAYNNNTQLRTMLVWTPSFTIIIIVIIICTITAASRYYYVVPCSLLRLVRRARRRATALRCQPLGGVAGYKAGARLISVSCRRRRHSKHYYNNNNDDGGGGDTATLHAADESNIWY